MVATVDHFGLNHFGPHNEQISLAFADNPPRYTNYYNKIEIVNTFTSL